MSRIFLTSDLHFGHQNIIKFNPDTRASDDPRLPEMKALCLAVEEEKDHNKRHDIRKQLKSLLKKMTVDMDQRMIQKWNSQVAPGDTVYNLGDVFFCGLARAREIQDQLNGTIHLVLGNHDRVIRNNQSIQKRFASVNELLDIKIGEYHVFMLHYPMVSWNRMHRGAFHLYGHAHGEYESPLRAMDVGVDSRPGGTAPRAGMYGLWHWDEILERLRDRPVGVHHG